MNTKKNDRFQFFFYFCKLNNLKMKIKIFLFIISIVIILLSSSCLQKNLRYLHKNAPKTDSTVYYETPPPTYKLKIYDVLNISVITTDEKINAIFNIGTSNTQRAGSGGEFFLSGFTVNDSGYVQVPIMGNFKLVGKTMLEVREIIQKRTDELLINAIINVKLVSFKISFLGEVNSQIFVYQDKIDFLEAVSRVGGVGDNADKRHIMIVRPTDKGSMVFYVDLTDRLLLTSEKIYLYPNDLVIVEPLKSKNVKLNVQEYMFWISAITSTLTTLYLIMTLTK